MKIQDEQFNRVPALRLIVLSALLLMQVGVTNASVYAQQAKPPIEKEGLLRSLSRKALPESELIQEITSRGVKFQLAAPGVEDEIRRAAKYLGKADIDKLIAVIRDNYRPHERLRVSLFKYEPCDQKYEVFATLLRSKVNQISGILSSKDGCRYTAGLKLVREETPFKMSLEEANQYWQKTSSLQLLQGMCSSKGEDAYVISQVFLGDLHGPLGSTVRIEFKVDPEEFANTRDMHTLLILYSLAQDARARGLSKDLIIAYLSEALGIAAQIKPAENATLQSIKSAIEALLRELGAADLLVLPK